MTKTKHGIFYVKDNELTWSRKKHGAGFSYLDSKGKNLSDKNIELIKKLTIPPAWKQVKICPNSKGHIQAIGTDDKGRKQYIYHPDWVAYNQQHKFNSLVRFGEVLPIFRQTIAAHMRQHQLSKERVLATVSWLLENTFIRVGNKTYEKENQSYGLTTLRNKHVDVTGNKINFSFKGKSGVYHELGISHPRVAQTIRQCIELPGYKIFQYLDESGQRQEVDSKEVNDYLKAITGESLSAKDFRTWGGTTLAGITLFELNKKKLNANPEQDLIQTVAAVSEHLGNTVAVCKKYYIHPKIFLSFKKNKLVPHFEKKYRYHRSKPYKLSKGEYAAWTLIQ